jgi:hypothetical protein
MGDLISCICKACGLTMLLAPENNTYMPCLRCGDTCSKSINRAGDSVLAERERCAKIAEDMLSLFEQPEDIEHPEGGVSDHTVTADYKLAHDPRCRLCQALAFVVKIREGK